MQTATRRSKSEIKAERKKAAAAAYRSPNLLHAKHCCLITAARSREKMVESMRDLKSLNEANIFLIQHHVRWYFRWKVEYKTWLRYVRLLHLRRVLPLP